MPFAGNLMTTGMGILPHREVERALRVAAGVDIPFWPQLPKMDYFEDMYVQASENFPGIVVEPWQRRIRFETERFYAGLEEALLNLDNEEYFRMSPRYSATYRRFLSGELAAAPAIRGQLEGPVSFGLNVLDENRKPILFNDEVRSLLFDFMARKAGCQLRELKEKNRNAFLFVDEPGLQSLWSAVSGYPPESARVDLEGFFAQVERPRGIHLCGNPDWDFLLGLDIDILSFNAYNSGDIFVKYRDGLRRFLDRGGMIGWGVVPANQEEYEAETLDGAARRIEELWGELGKAGFELDRLVARSILLPATCALVNPDGFETVERAYESLRRLSRRLQRRYHLGGGQPPV